MMAAGNSTTTSEEIGFTCPDCLGSPYRVTAKQEHVLQFHFRRSGFGQWTDRQFLKSQLDQETVFAHIVEDLNNNTFPFFLNWTRISDKLAVFWVSQHFEQTDDESNQHEFAIRVFTDTENEVVTRQIKTCLPQGKKLASECQGFVLDNCLFDEVASSGILFCQIMIRRKQIAT